MTSLIINLPQLQSRRQRRGALLLSLLCWAWFVMPLVIVIGWLLGLPMAQEVVWLGGWQGLVRLAGIAASIFLALTGAWTLWTLLEIDRERRHPATAPGGAAVGFAVEWELVELAKQSLLTTVHFAPGGAIATIVPEMPAVQLRAA